VDEFTPFRKDDDEGVTERFQCLEDQPPANTVRLSLLLPGEPV
jgi:hypothetical protein